MLGDCGRVGLVGVQLGLQRIDMLGRLRIACRRAAQVVVRRVRDAGPAGVAHGRNVPRERTECPPGGLSEAGRMDVRPYHEQIDDAPFREAVELLDAGDSEGLRAHLRQHPGLARRRVAFDGEPYFSNPTLLEFAAENPVRRGSLPPNIAEAAAVVLDAGGGDDRSSVEKTLGLVASGRVARECGVQVPLIDLLCERGADPDRAIGAALAHGEFGAADALLRRGATVDLPVAAALGRVSDAVRSLPDANGEERQAALALAAQHGHAEIVRLLLDAGENPSRYNPAGTHAHSTPLHQAVLGGHDNVVKMLVERGAGLEFKDRVYEGTPLDWALYAGHDESARYLRAHGAKTAEELTS